MMQTELEIKKKIISLLCLFP